MVVDIGCGPGNVHASLKCSPQLLIGVDVSANALAMAERLGYTPLLADAHALPLVDQFADYVVLNATLHHCDDMTRVLAEAARLVRPGGSSWLSTTIRKAPPMIFAASACGCGTRAGPSTAGSIGAGIHRKTTSKHGPWPQNCTTNPVMA